MKIWKRDFYEKLLFGKTLQYKRETVLAVQEQIRKLQERIQELQSFCKHEHYTVTFYSWRPGAMDPARICNKCSAVVEGITSEESHKLWNEYHNQTGQISWGPQGERK